ncbi:trypsin-like peptidase domain-containing protein [Luteolibacter arcticus]|uniref:Trypsin-like peptidase domain-containing protein n=1 Tax=Luteolibacter arcticus TaxID=1581411 RepID=A0ABT3GI93_9BACT|nr:trypsin-like peptidase domain-containing protein [Luteolibacter arcticus]MCW1923225.1 trypsin-like peptidase domain-containing protein [Luteolibacter arcticus]
MHSASSQFCNDDMNVEFECPGCQQSLSADVPATGVDVTCPACSTAFHVDAPEVAIPTVKARIATAPVTVAPASAPVNRPGPGPGPRPPGGAPHRTAYHPPPAASSGDGKLIAIIAVAVLALAGGGYGIWAAASKAEEKKKAFLAAPTMQEQARQKLAELALKDAERRERESAERQKNIEKNRIEIAKREKEDAARLDRERDVKLTKIAQEHFNGDKVAAAELLKEADAVNEEINKLFADNVQGNEPQTQAEFYQTFNRLFERRIKSNPIISKALAGNNSMTEFLSESPGEAFTKNAELLEKYGSFGSGFFISADGWLVTNRHVVGKADTVDLRTSDGKIVPAQVVARDPKNDLALLKADVKSSTWLPVSQGGKELELGDSVFTIGFPNPVMQGLEPKYTDGRVSSRAGMMDDEAFYQISVPVQPGNSGGPLIDMESGWAVGVITLRLDRTSDGRNADNVSYALKAAVLHQFVSGTPEAAPALKAAAADKPAGASAIIARAKGASATILVPN